MKYTIKNTKGLNVKIFDSFGRSIPFATAYDTKTSKMTLFITHTNSNGQSRILSELDENGKPKAKKITTIWRGSYVKVNGVRVK